MFGRFSSVVIVSGKINFPKGSRDDRDPQKIVCVGLNYRDHAEEQGTALPEQPLLFAKWTNTLIGDGDAIRIPPITKQVDYEAELGVVIGTRRSRVSRDDALGHVRQVCRGERRLGARPPVRRRPVDPRQVARHVPSHWRSRARVWRYRIRRRSPIRAILDGETLQDSNTGDMIFGVAEIVSFVSQAITLEPGDLIITGTPAGVGAFREPPIWLKPGDEITIEIDGIGSITNPVTSAD